MITKEAAKKLVSYMPDLISVDNAIEIFYKLDQMEQELSETGKEIDWEELKKDIASW